MFCVVVWLLGLMAVVSFYAQTLAGLPSWGSSVVSGSPGTRGMDESKSPVKPVKQSHPRGAKTLSGEKSSKEAPVQRESAKSAPRSKENPAAARDEHNVGSQASRGPKSFTETNQDKRRGRPPRLNRLTGRTSSGESCKGRVTSSQQQLSTKAPDSNASAPADSTPSAKRESSSPVVPGTPEKGLKVQSRSVIVVPAKEKSHGETI